jgi:hypothetical protein
MTNLSNEEAHWEALVSQHSPNVRERVFQTYKRWNQPIRDCLRAETGLRLNIGDDFQTIPVTVCSGLTRHFKGVLKQCEGIEWLLLNRPKLERAKAGLQLVYDGPSLFVGIEEFLTRRNIPVEDVANKDEIGKCRDTVAVLLNIIEQQQFSKKVFCVDEDVLGTYNLNRPSIKLMWLPIAIISANMGVAPEALTVVVLTHELAHAFTHVGRDIDGNQWQTHDMASSDLSIVEGLAQYYTNAVCTRLSSRFPQPLDVFNSLLEHQADCYKAYKSWFENNEPSGEIIRASLLQCRAKKMHKAEPFLEAIRKITEHRMA